jgi:hypothetical protein
VDGRRRRLAHEPGARGHEVRVADGGTSIDVVVWDVPAAGGGISIDDDDDAVL